MVAIVNNHQFISANPQSKVTPAGKQYGGLEQQASVSGLAHTSVTPKDSVQISSEGRFVAAVAEFEKSIMNLRRLERANIKVKNTKNGDVNVEPVDDDGRLPQQGRFEAPSLEEIGNDLKAALRRILDELSDSAADNDKLKERIAELRHRLKLDNAALSGLVESGVLKPVGRGYNLDVSVLQQIIAPVLRAATR